MNTTGIIVEYNPFHNGHQYHLNKSKEISSSDNLIAVMSGNFSQRGQPAVLDKWARTEQALSSGADLVIELPLAYNIRSAEFFAYYSVLILEKTNLVDTIVFGSETANLEILTAAAAALVNESKFFQDVLKRNLKKGCSFPEAREKALLETQTENEFLKNYEQKDLKKALTAPNNILAIEYLKALIKIDSRIKAKTIKRIGTGYHSQKINKNYASASLIRKIINKKAEKEALLELKNLMPLKSWQILKREIKKGRYCKKSSQKLIKAKIIDQLRRMTKKELLAYKGISGGFENRLLEKAAAADLKGSDFLTALKTKNLTESRIRRILLQLYFNLNAEKLNLIQKNGPHYIRVLGVKKGKEKLLAQLEKNSKLEIIINPSVQLSEINLASTEAKELSLSYDLLASDLYALLYENQEYSQAGRDFHQRFIKV